MTDTSSQDGKAVKARKASNPLDDLMEFMATAIDDVDEKAAEVRVQAMREAHPNALVDELVELLVKQKCMQTGAVGAITSGMSIIPGLGTLASLTFGVALDIGLTFKFQAELVLEIAAVYQHKFSPTEKRNTVMLVTGISAGANQALRKAGQRVAEEATERLAQKSLTKAIPLLGTAASAGTNILFTYVIGQRAQAYFGLGPEAVGDWGESIRAITGVDERKVTNWLAETTERSWTLVRDGAKDATDSVIVAGKSAGEVVVVRVNEAADTIPGVGRSIVERIDAATDAVADWGKKTGEDVASGAQKAGETFTGAGRTIAKGASAAADVVVETGRKTRSAVATGIEKAAEAVTDIGDEVGEAVTTTKNRVKETVKRSSVTRPDKRKRKTIRLRRTDDETPPAKEQSDPCMT